MILYRVYESGPNIIRMWKSKIGADYSILLDGELIMDLSCEDEAYATVITSSSEIGRVFRKYLYKI